MSRKKPGWYLVFADLAFILFLMALSALTLEGAQVTTPVRPTEIAPSQALFRSTEDGGSFDDWLEAQTSDSRQMLTIVAHYRSPAERLELWDKAGALAKVAEAKGLQARVVIAKREGRDLYVSLAFDDLETANLSGR